MPDACDSTRRPPGTPRRVTGAAGAVVALLLVGAAVSGCSSSPSRPTSPTRSGGPVDRAEDLPPLTAAWRGATHVRGNALVQGALAIAAAPTTDTPADARTVTVGLTHGQFVAIPESCEESSTIQERSFISEDGRRLTCLIDDGDRHVRFTARVDDGVARLSGTASLGTAATRRLPTLPVAVGTTLPQPSLRLLSSPDFLNYDIGDLANGPNQWQPGRTANSVNGYWRRAISHVMDDWVKQKPAEVLVAGDLVDGHWGKDTTGSGNFGPVTTHAQQVRALDEAARTYYPQYFARFHQRGLIVRPAVGDHEMGDNPWPLAKRQLADTFRARFADYVTRRRDGGFRFPSHPQGLHRFTAYAWRPQPDVQLVTLDVFDVTADRARVQLDNDQLRWLHGVLAKARHDGVRWIVVQAHTPILQPVRRVDSSGLHYRGGRKSPLWKLFVKYHVNLYLCGEVHAVTASQDDGVVQIAHGGAFSNDLTNYMLLDFYRDRINLTLRDFVVTSHPVSGPRLWETQGRGVHPYIAVRPGALTIGTGDVTSAGLVHRSGLLRPWDGVSPY